MKASHYLTDLADALEISKSGFLPINKKGNVPALNRTTNYPRRSSRSLWPAARLTAVHASCMRCAEADGAVAKIASPGSCAHAACAPDKSVDLDPKQLRATINCRWHQTGWPRSQSRTVPARSGWATSPISRRRRVGFIFPVSWTIVHDVVSAGMRMIRWRLRW